MNGGVDLEVYTLGNLAAGRALSQRWKTTGDQACGSQGVGGRAAGGTHGRQLELHPRRWAWCPEKHPRYPLCQPVALQLKDQAGGAVPQRSTLCRGMWLLVLPLGFCWNSPTASSHHRHYHHHLIPVSRKPVHSQSHHDFRTNGHISPSPPVTLALCPLPGSGLP